MSEVINSNPTVLEAWELPSRQQAPSKQEVLELRNLAEVSLFADDVSSFSDGDYMPDAPELETDEFDPVDAQEIFDLIKTISDPEHPLSLGQLAVVARDRITVQDTNDPQDIALVHIQITPTITHCSLATLIGLGIRVRLERSLPPRFRVKITITPGSHQSEHQVNKQLNDKERVAAATENEQLLKVIAGMLATCD